MAVTGCLLFIFLVGHLLGNLQIFLGPEAINAYAKFLHSKPALVWGSRIGLLVLGGVHVISAIRLALENKRARPVPYQQYQMAAASYASRTMVMSGLILLTFIIYHLLHFTAQVPAVNLIGPGDTLPTGSFADLMDAEHHQDVFRMIVLGFSNLWVSAFYILGVGLVGLHLSHGLSSMFQSMGWKRRPYGRLLDGAALLVGWVIFLGYASIPVAIFLGYGKN